MPSKRNQELHQGLRLRDGRRTAGHVRLLDGDEHDCYPPRHKKTRWNTWSDTAVPTLPDTRQVLWTTTE